MKKLFIMFIMLVSVALAMNGVAFASSDGNNGKHKGWYKNKGNNDPSIEITNSGGRGGNATIEKGAVRNTNNNSNIQGQMQGQMQGQLQGQDQSQDQSQDQNQGQDQSQETNVSIVDNSIDRDFTNIGGTPIPVLNNFLTTPTPDSSFRSIKDIFRDFMGDGVYMMKISEGALKSWAKGGDVDAHLQILRDENYVNRIYTKKFKGVKYLYLAVEEPVVKNNKIIATKRIDGLDVTGYVDGEADDGDTNSIQVIGKAGLKALKDGNNFMVITKEGSHRMADASGWGIGFYTVGSTVSGTGEASSAVGGGTGYSHNKASTEDKPWIHGYVGVKNME